MLDTLRNLAAEGAFIEEQVRDLSPQEWRRQTPAVGWTIAHQIAHLAWTDAVSLASLRDAFAPYRGADVSRIVNDSAAEGAAAEPAELLRRWVAGREELAEALAGAEPKQRLEWFGPSMSARAMATARVMKTWAHGQDIADAIGVEHPDSAALKDVAFLGVMTRNFSYNINGLQPPTEEFRIELQGPGGQQWQWGPEDATNGVRGSAQEFCLLVTQRREPEQLSLHVFGEQARQWVGFAQAFAGPSKEQVRAQRVERR